MIRENGVVTWLNIMEQTASLCPTQIQHVLGARGRCADDPEMLWEGGRGSCLGTMATSWLILCHMAKLIQ